MKRATVRLAFRGARKLGLLWPEPSENLSAKFSRELSLSRNTVCRVLSQTEHQQVLAEFRCQLLDLLPECLRVARHRLRHNSEKIAIEILQGTQVMVGKTEQDIHHHVDDFEGWTEDELEQFASTGVRPSTIGKA